MTALLIKVNRLIAAEELALSLRAKFETHTLTLLKLAKAALLDKAKHERTR